MKTINNTQITAVYNQMIQSINFTMDQMKNEWNVFQRDVVTSVLLAKDRERKLGEKSRELATQYSGATAELFYDTIEKVAQQQDPGFAITSLSNEQQKNLSKIFIDTLKKWGNYVASHRTEDNPFPSLEVQAGKKMSIIQEMFSKIAKFFRSIVGKEKAADLFEDAVKFVVKVRAKNIVQVAIEGGIGSASPLSPTRNRDIAR